MTESFDGKKLYVRRDSKLHKWLSAQNLIENIDSNKDFLYLGETFDSPLRELNNSVDFFQRESFYFNHYAMKNYVEAALPEINRKELFIDFLRAYFDEVYQYIYNKQDSILDIANPLITDVDFLKIIAYSYDVEYVYLTIFQENCIRLFLHAMPHLIKMKGCFSAFWIIFKILQNGTTNRLNIYSLWHGTDRTSDWRYYTRQLLNAPSQDDTSVTLLKSNIGDIFQIPYSGELYDLALSIMVDVGYGAGYGFYTDAVASYTYREDNILSTHYVLEFDVTEQPMKNDSIWDESFENLITILEEFRPASRVSHYGILTGPITDWTGNWTEMYPDYAVSFKTRFNPIFNKDPDSYIYIQSTPRNIWTFKHPLLTIKVLVQVFCDNRMIIPQKIIYVDAETISIVFGEDLTGYAIVKIYNEDRFFMVQNETVFDYNLAQLPIIAARDMISYCIPENQAITNDDNTLTTKFSSNFISHTDMVVTNDYLHTQSVAETEWIINHDAGYSASLIMVYDENKNVIYPQEIFSIDDKVVTLTFTEPQTGFAVLNFIGNPIESASTISLLKSYETYFKFGEKKWLDSDIFNDLKQPIMTIGCEKFWEDSDYLYLQCTLPEFGSIDIKEVGIFDKLNRLIFYSKVEGFFKPSGIYSKFHYRIKK